MTDNLLTLTKRLKGQGMNQDECAEFLSFSTGVSNERLENALKSAYSKDDKLTQRIREYICNYVGEFPLTQLDNELGITGRDKESRRTVMKRLVKEGLIENTKIGFYRRIEGKLPEMDWYSADTRNTIDIKFPMDIDELVNIHPKSIIVMAGNTNAGKTAFILNFARLNKDKFDIHYFTSELSEQEFKKRIELFGEGIDEWKDKIHVYDRSHDFDSVIIPDAVNIIDYLAAPGGEYYKIADLISDIHLKLTTGIALIAIQKSTANAYGRGGEFSAERARVYLSLDEGKLTIIKAKDRKTEVNPNGVVINHKLVDGCRFTNISRDTP